MRLLPITLIALLSACATVPTATKAPVEVQILAFNDFHGNLETPKDPITVVSNGQHLAPARYGGVVPLAVTLQQLRGGRVPEKDTLTVSAGDLISASPLISAHFLDEPTVMAMNMVGLNLNAVGNHEFDKGWQELLRMQHGGCVKYTSRAPCQVDRFPGAKFQFLAANVVTDKGPTLLPGTAMKTIHGVKLGFVGMTLKDTGTLVSPLAVKGLTFTDEVETANAAARALIADGAQAVILMIHQGGYVDKSYQLDGCKGLSRYIVPIVEKLDPAIKLVVSGHTHHAYICQMPDGAGGMRTVTSTGKYGYMVSDIRLNFGPDGRYLGASALNHLVDSKLTGNPQVEALLRRYQEAVGPIGDRVIGRLSGPIRRDTGDLESALSRFVSDGMLFAGRDKGADVAFTNTTGVRVDIIPEADGAVRYKQIFAMQPFNNMLLMLEMTGTDIQALLEQMFLPDGNVRSGSWLIPSHGFTYRADKAQPFGQRVSDLRLNGQPIDPAKTYRVITNNFLAAGGDGFSEFSRGKLVADLGLDLDATEAWVRTAPATPTEIRIARP